MLGVAQKILINGEINGCTVDRVGSGENCPAAIAAIHRDLRKNNRRDCRKSRNGILRDGISGASHCVSTDRSRIFQRANRSDPGLNHDITKGFVQARSIGVFAHVFADLNVRGCGRICS